MSAATKFRFETSFDNGAGAAADAAAHAQAAEVDSVRQDAEAAGFSRGHAQAMGEIEAHTQSLLGRLAVDMQVLFDALDGVKRQLIADGAIAASTAGSTMAGALIQKLPEQRIASLMEALIQDVIDTPRLVLRVSAPMLDQVRTRMESLAQTHGFSGRLIFLGEVNFADSDITIEWAHGGLSFSAQDQQQRIQQITQAFVESILGGGDVPTAQEVHA
jgi:flagellar assembly protein FliH